MRLWKKVSAMVAMAAMCMTLAVPVTASAAEVDARTGGCAQHNWTETMVRYRVDSTYPHDYVLIAENKDGSVTIIKGVCTVEERTAIHYKACTNCGIVQTEGSESAPDKHSSCGQ